MTITVGAPNDSPIRKVNKIISNGKFGDREITSVQSGGAAVLGASNYINAGLGGIYSRSNGLSGNDGTTIELPGLDGTSFAMGGSSGKDLYFNESFSAGSGGYWAGFASMGWPGECYIKVLG